MFKKILFQVHWFIGITAGTILMAIGVTGAVLSFREEILDLINPGVMHVAPRQQALLTPQQIAERLHAVEPEKRIVNLTLLTEPGASVRISFAAAPGERRGEVRFADPYSGALLPPLSGNDFFEFNEKFHRWLLLPVDSGKIAAGTLSLCLLFLALSGLYLRWPRRALSVRQWLKLDFALSGRSFLWSLHSVVGTWVLVVYLLLTLTGLFWAFDWFKQGVYTLAGETMPVRAASQNNKPKDKPKLTDTTPVDLTLVWNSFLREAGPYTLVSIRLPEQATQPAQVSYLDPAAVHERARNRITIMPLTGDIKTHELYAQKSEGARFIGAIYPLHMGTYFGLPGRIVIMVASLLMPLFGISGWMLYLDRRRKKRANAAERAMLAQVATKESHATTDKDLVLIAYASQTGQAESIALQTASALQTSGLQVKLESMANLTCERLRHFHRAVFVVSTFGDGEAPDSARRFASQLEQQASHLQHLQYALLALGDKNYSEFCGFGHTLEHWLRNQNAQPLFDMIEVNNGDAASAAASLAHWQQSLCALTGGVALTSSVALAASQTTSENPFHAWKLLQRQHLNAGSGHAGIYHLELAAPANLHLTWQSGALAEVLPRHPSDLIALLLHRMALDGNTVVQYRGQACRLEDALARSALPRIPHEKTNGAARSAQALADSLTPLAARQYSIASIPEDGTLHLLVRQFVSENGLGLASGWLTDSAEIGSMIELRLRPNSSFALVKQDEPDSAAIFIGNGSGLAGLRSHLRARIAQGQHRNWLLFGERERQYDFHYREELELWLQQGQLQRLDMAFSRDQSERVYVQDKLREAAAKLKTWIEDGAVLYVCGSLDGMAAGVDAALTDILGSAALHDLIAQGRYRRDVY